MHHKYFLSIGSNIEPKLEHLNRAIKELNLYGKIVKKSSIYITEPWGEKDQTDFYNAVISFKSRLSPTELLNVIKEIENKMGRIKQKRWGERPIDIDILFADDLIMNNGDLVIPHKFLIERRFVLAPLAELTEDLQLPYFYRTAEEILHECADSSRVEKLISGWA